jgi:DNA-directed RNA polymerase subunit K/omega
MADMDFVELNVEELERRGINRYKAVLMAAQEARFINNQIRLDIIKSDDKPTTLAMKRLFEGRVVEAEAEPAEGAAPATPSA